jgi:hypothetical protein
MLELFHILPYGQAQAEQKNSSNSVLHSLNQDLLAIDNVDASLLLAKTLT